MRGFWHDLSQKLPNLLIEGANGIKNLQNPDELLLKTFDSKIYLITIYYNNVNAFEILTNFL